MSIKVSIKTYKRVWHSKELERRSKNYYKITLIPVSLSLILIIASMITGIDKLSTIAMIIALSAFLPLGVVEGLNIADRIMHDE